MKRFLIGVAPLVMMSALLFFLVGFKQMKRLDASERQAIEQYKKAYFEGNHLRVRGIFSEEEYQTVSVSLDRLHQDTNYKVFGHRFGVKLQNPKEEFTKVKNLLFKRGYPQKQRKFLEALNLDLMQAEKHYGTRVAHDLLSDLSYYVFPKEDQKKEDQLGSPKTLRVMKDIKMTVS